jgi:O-acetyl-ADP-ribose deacetylase (regulator of RNase III)
MLTVSHGILVHGCNARGRMGKGIAAQIKKQFPAAFQVYEHAYRTEGLKLGTITHAEVARDLHIVNAVTQDHWHHPDPTFLLADYDAIESAFRLVRDMARARSQPVHFPLIGCGLAHGDWTEVAPRIERALGPEIEKTLWLLPERVPRT